MVTGLDTRMSRVRSLAHSVIDLHGRYSPFSLMQHSGCTVVQGCFSVGLQGRCCGHGSLPDLSSHRHLTSAEAEPAKAAARKDSRTQ